MHAQNAQLQLKTTAQQAFEAENYPHARTCFEKLLKADPKNPDIFNLIGSTYMLEKNYMRAAQQFKKGLSFASHHSYLLANLAKAHLLLGEFDDVFSVLDRAEAYTAEAYITQSETHLALGTYAKAAQSAQKAFQHPKATQLQKDSGHILHAITSYLQGDIKAVPQQMAPIAKTFDTHKGVLWIGGYYNYLNGLCAYRAKHPVPTARYKPLYWLGDSHTLGPAFDTLLLQDENYTSYAQIALNARGFHIATQLDKCVCNALIHHSQTLEKTAPLVFAFGEIDCRQQSAFMNHILRTGGNLNDIVQKMTHGYVAYSVKTFQSWQAPLFFYGVPAPNGATTKASKDLWDLFLQLVPLFNHYLKEAALAHNAHFIDIYAETVGKGGVAKKEVHIDLFHLQPHIVKKTVEKAFHQYTAA